MTIKILTILKSCFWWYIIWCITSTQIFIKNNIFFQKGSNYEKSDINRL